MGDSEPSEITKIVSSQMRGAFFFFLTEGVFLAFPKFSVLIGAPSVLRALLLRIVYFGPKWLVPPPPLFTYTYISFINRSRVTKLLTSTSIYQSREEKRNNPGRHAHTRRRHGPVTAVENEHNGVVFT